MEVPEADVPLADAVASYLFNTQLVTLPDGNGMALIAPTECDTTPQREVLPAGAGRGGQPDHAVHTIDLTQSMRNGGGPACLRLRVVLSEEDLGRLGANVLLDETLLDRLEAWVNRHYREDLESRRPGRQYSASSRIAGRPGRADAVPGAGADLRLSALRSGTPCRPACSPA